MTNNFENENHDEFTDVEHLEEHGSTGKPPRGGMIGNLTEVWRSRPLFKFVVLIAAVFAVGIAAINFFGSGSSNDEVAHIGRPPNLKEAPGGEASPYMKQQTELANQERSAQAIAQGGSALPTPIGQTTDVGGFGATDKRDDPLNELRIETEKLKEEVQQQRAQQQVQQQQQQRQPEQFDNSLAEAMQHQLQQIIEGWTPDKLKEVTVIKPEDAAKATAAAQAASAGSSAESTPTPPPKIVVNAGTVSYAQLLTEANSDVPGPILAQIVSGPLAGSRAVGSFQVSQGYEKYLVLKFTLADRKGTDYPINAYALDPDTTLGGMATEVDERYFVRVILPAAAGFLQGMGQALGQSNNTITTDGTTSISSTAGSGFRQGVYNGLGQAATTAGQFFQDQANLTQPLVRVAAGTAMGLFFISPVFDPNGPQPTPQNNTYMNMASYNPLMGTPGYPSSGYPSSGYPSSGYPTGYPSPYPPSVPAGSSLPGMPGYPPAGYNPAGYNPYGYNGTNGYYPGSNIPGYGAPNNTPNGNMPYPNYATPGYAYGQSVPAAYGTSQFYGH